VSLALVLGALLAIGCVVAVALPYLRDPAPADDRLDRPGELEQRQLELSEVRDRALAALKELEFDRAMGKLSAKDFDEMSARLRTRALSLMRQLDADATGYRAVIEQELARRVRESAHAAPERPSTAAGVSTAPACVCGTANDPDAVFCKRCGARLSAEGARA